MITEGISVSRFLPKIEPAQIATFHIIMEQTIEMNSALYNGFVHYEKVFESIVKEFLCKQMKHNGIPH